jgi:hypothetical protein
MQKGFASLVGFGLALVVRLPCIAIETCRNIFLTTHLETTAHTPVFVFAANFSGKKH